MQLPKINLAGFWSGLGTRRERMAAHDSAPRETTIETALDALPENMQEHARKQIAAHGADGWVNVLTSLGVEGKDPTVSTTVARSAPIGQADLELVYRFEGIARKIVDIPVREMFRRGFRVEGDRAGLFVKWLHKSKMDKALKKLAKLGRLYGGALGVLIVDDGQADLEKPLNLKAVKAIKGMNVFDRWQVAWFPDQMYQKPEHPKFMQPEKYLIFPLYGNPFWVHETRVLRYDGAFLPARTEQANSGWADSVLQSPWDKLRALGEVFGYSKNIIRTFIIQTLSMEGISKMIAAGNERVLADRMKILRVWMSALNMVPLDATEKYEKSASTITGLPDMIDRFYQWLCADTDIPVSVLFGRVSSGLSGTGDADSQHTLFYERVAEEQEENLRPLLERIMEICLAASEGPYAKAAKPENPHIDFLPLAEPTEFERAQTRYQNAQADSLAIQDGVLDPIEVRRSRYAGPDNPGGDIVLEEEELEMDVGDRDPSNPKPKPEDEPTSGQG